METGQLQVYYVSTHNHQLTLENTKFQPMPQSIRTGIKARLSLGVPVQEIYKDLRVTVWHHEIAAMKI